MNEYGLNLGIAFQIADYYLDLIGKKENLGKISSSDFKMSELALLMLNLFSESRDKKKILSLMESHNDRNAFKKIKRIFVNFPVVVKTEDDISFYIARVKDVLGTLTGSRFLGIVYLI